ncbi:hypothetical protein Taro_041820 [Colocasia esculenta]|uniref:AB hydrolase-1 domain-containing protein n=1 Tax=Colocasia esculenta TaxID=4460 RepID=A0A843X1A1_COLES|nr:hypothetical protein [Colocasia esculenta]
MRPPSLSLRRWWRVAAETLLSAASFLVFAFLDLLDVALCFFYRVADAVLEERPIPCYCRLDGGRSREGEGREGEKRGDCGGGGGEVSETLYGRKNVFREMGLLGSRWGRREGGKEKGRSMRSPRWSDCSCKACVSWVGDGDGKLLHFVMKEPSSDARDGRSGSTTEVIFLHGFLSSSSIWTETVFSNLSEAAAQNCRLFAVDLLGFGQSPKPADCFYTLGEHIGMIERTIIEPFQLDSFHLVAHSMGCIIALAIAAKHRELVRSITVVAPPYFCSTKDIASHNALNKLAARRLWPLSLFGSSVMSWYEHLGRSICFIVCRNHRKWEWILKLITRRDPHFLFVDITKHTHHSAWHTMHNVICGGAKSLEEHLEALSGSGIPAKVIHGSKDQVVPLECSYSVKSRAPFLDLQVIPGADHISVVLGRERDFTRSLEELWFSSSKA